MPPQWPQTTSNRLPPFPPVCCSRFEIIQTILWKKIWCVRPAQTTNSGITGHISTFKDVIWAQGKRRNLRLCWKILQWKHVTLQFQDGFYPKIFWRIKENMELGEPVPPTKHHECKDVGKIALWKDRTPNELVSKNRREAAKIWQWCCAIAELRPVPESFADVSKLRKIFDGPWKTQNRHQQRGERTFSIGSQV